MSFVKRQVTLACGNPQWDSFQSQDLTQQERWKNGKNWLLP